MFGDDKDGSGLSKLVVSDVHIELKPGLAVVVPNKMVESPEQIIESEPASTRGAGEIMTFSGLGSEGHPN